MKSWNKPWMEANLIMTAVDFTTGKTAKNLKEQMIAALKKFKGRTIITDEAGGASKEKSEKAVMVAEITDVLLSQGWKPPKTKGRKRSRSESPKQQGGGYKGKKNPLDKNYKQMKCFLCACDHTE